MRPLETMPDARGHFGPYGGMFVPETLMTALEELTAKYERGRVDPNFRRELDTLLHDFAGRPTPLYYAERLTQKLAAAKICLKREAACRSRSTADMISRLSVVEEESDEVIYWIELLTEAGFVRAQKVESLRNEVHQIVAMSVASIKTLRSRALQSLKPKI
jgi:four helix bundle protein